MKRGFPVFAGPESSARRWFSVKAASGEAPAEINIYDDIGKDWWSGEGVGGKEFAQELKTIPKGQKILVRVNSRGGNVHDGMLIYNLLNERRADVTTRNDGVALSIASVILLAGSKVEMPRNSLFMIHDPWTVAQGNASEMRAAADMLDKHRDAMLTVYKAKTGKTEQELKDLMAAETWFTGQEAKDAGFADEVSDEISLQAAFDLSKFKRVPSQLKNLQNKGEHMNRKAIIARLKRLGISFDEKASTETLNALLAENTARAKLEARAKELNVAIEANIADRDLELLVTDAIEAAADAQDDADAQDTEPEPEPEPEPSAATRKQTNRTRLAARDGSLGTKARSNPEIENRLKLIEAKYAAERKQRIEREVNECVSEDRIPAAQAQEWIDEIVAADEDRGAKLLARLKAMEPKPPGARSVRPELISDSPQDVVKGLIQFRQPLASWMRGNDVDIDAITSAARSTAVAIRDHRKKLNGILAANTIDPNLKRTVILNDLMRAYRRRLILLSVFTTKFDNVQAQLGSSGGLNTVTVPFYELDTTASQDFNSATGYTFAGDTSVGSRQITINKRKYQTMDFSSETFRRQPYFNADQSLMLKAEQLGVDVWTDVLSLVKASNYSTVAMAIEPSTFDSDDMATLQQKADDADWPELARSFVGGTAHRTSLNQDDSIKHWMNANSTEALREGSPGRLSGFDTFFSPRIPTNGEDLSAFICRPDAALVAAAPIIPAPGVRQQLLSVEVVIDPDTGMSFVYRYGADVWADKDREVIECSYGFAKGNGSALQRITAGAANFSSTSSASSVNSSSSSSSSPSY